MLSNRCLARYSLDWAMRAALLGGRKAAAATVIWRYYSHDGEFCRMPSPLWSEYFESKRAAIGPMTQYSALL